MPVMEKVLWVIKCMMRAARRSKVNIEINVIFESVFAVPFLMIT